MEEKRRTKMDNAVTQVSLGMKQTSIQDYPDKEAKAQFESAASHSDTSSETVSDVYDADRDEIQYIVLNGVKFVRADQLATHNASMKETPNVPTQKTLWPGPGVSYIRAQSDAINALNGNGNSGEYQGYSALEYASNIKEAEDNLRAAWMGQFKNLRPSDILGKSQGDQNQAPVDWDSHGKPETPPAEQTDPEPKTEQEIEQEAEFKTQSVNEPSDHVEKEGMSFTDFTSPVAIFVVGHEKTAFFVHTSVTPAKLLEICEDDGSNLICYLPDEMPSPFHRMVTYLYRNGFPPFVLPTRSGWATGLMDRGEGVTNARVYNLAVKYEVEGLPEDILGTWNTDVSAIDFISTAKVVYDNHTPDAEFRDFFRNNVAKVIRATACGKYGTGLESQDIYLRGSDFVPFAEQGGLFAADFVEALVQAQIDDIGATMYTPSVDEVSDGGEDFDDLGEIAGEGASGHFSAEQKVYPSDDAEDFGNGGNGLNSQESGSGLPTMQPTEPEASLTPGMDTNGTLADMSKMAGDAFHQSFPVAQPPSQSINGWGTTKNPMLFAGMGNGHYTCGWPPHEGSTAIALHSSSPVDCTVNFPVGATLTDLKFTGKYSVYGDAVLCGSYGGLKGTFPAYYVCSSLR